MLQNIHIAAGPLPAETGDLRQDYQNIRNYLEALLRALEQSFDQIDQKIGGGKNV
ncbi:MAG: hypothetical protein J6K89_07790 [Oscillospiraceae bacterium]|nr:hypothetical protein [Oscillospiraceae bacterium]